jgi:hypothetical protein
MYHYLTLSLDGRGLGVRPGSAIAHTTLQVWKNPRWGRKLRKRDDTGCNPDAVMLEIASTEKHRLARTIRWGEGFGREK